MAVKLKRPAGLVNPDAFDYEAWLLAQRIGATGTVVDGQLLAPARAAWRDAIRQRLLAVDARAGRAVWQRWCWAMAQGYRAPTGRCCRIPALCICWSFPASTSVCWPG